MLDLLCGRGLTRKGNHWVTLKRTIQQSHPPEHKNKRLRRWLPAERKKRKTPQSPTSHPPSLPQPQVYVTLTFVPPFVPAYPQVPCAHQPMHEERSDDVVMLRRVPTPSPFTPSLPVPPPSGIARLSRGVHSSQATSSTQSSPAPVSQQRSATRQQPAASEKLQRQPTSSSQRPTASNQ